jgi:hypothetical protein
VTKKLPACDCLNYCGDDPWLKSGKSRYCQEYLAKQQKIAENIAIQLDNKKCIARYKALRLLGRTTDDEADKLVEHIAAEVNGNQALPLP